jgi:TolB-like protein
MMATLAGLLFAAAGHAAAATNLAVFNFQLKTGQDDWVWLEKFMSDQMATDLVQDRSLSVIARDRMQLLAQQYKWVPEFATGDAKVMGGIRSQLSIEYLVTGVCSVRDDQLEITAQIVEVQTRQEVHRKTVSGKTGQVIDLQKQLSADVMAWFTKRPAGEILKTLPMWTRSIPAVRALYEGMHLYDQGRYAEGWVKFRDASREDKNYVEAVYWVGKMYYFMYRYEHVRAVCSIVVRGRFP